MCHACTVAQLSLSQGFIARPPLHIPLGGTSLAAQRALLLPGSPRRGYLAGCRLWQRLRRMKNVDALVQGREKSSDV